MNNLSVLRKIMSQCDEDAEQYISIEKHIAHVLAMISMLAQVVEDIIEREKEGAK